MAIACPREAWTHGAHVGVCAYYAFDHDEEATLAIMRPGIRTFNESIGGQNTATSGYHESDHAALGDGHCGAPARDIRAASRWEAARSAVARFASPRELLRQCYSFDVVADQRAHALNGCRRTCRSRGTFAVRRPELQFGHGVTRAD